MRQGAEQRAVSDTPELDVSVDASGGDCLRIGAKSDAPDFGGMGANDAGNANGGSATGRRRTRWGKGGPGDQDRHGQNQANKGDENEPFHRERHRVQGMSAGNPAENR